MSRVEFMQGNAACAEGALAAGCRFFGGYPITPSTEIAETMARRLPKVGGVFISMEDELASIAAVIGAAWTGTRAMTATSGPGFSLMMENIGYAAMTETPCVIVNIQRGGPSTGQPTRAAQGDMLQCRFGSHGDYSTIALTPNSVQEMFDLTVKAFNLANRFRVPTLLMSDEIVGHMRERMAIPDSVDIIPPAPLAEGSLPFEAGDDGVPGFAPFGSGRSIHVTGLTHDERGYPDTTDPEAHDRLVRRLVTKVESARREIADYVVTNPDAETVFVTYGPPSRTVEQVMHTHPDDDIGHLRLRLVWPFPEFALQEFPNAKVFLMPELNMGQMVREVQRHVDQPVISIPKIGGELHTPAELVRILEAHR
ncbi:MAG TPA: 2-oxoacid:acceptor oxidoreductase subunit alpha [Candidatus Methanoculleus thermohydrogenotrophicum]|nr:2-oxoacid:acceptor oxidoreductase subunit alpha [Candidatus Methanoculleus thermohydrogenotrophicum]HOB17079.1 2-oxoacid:acceptor oxidoreductase subunit alpha [Candidatus Methanoculleus thermohydrogenotrophicum]HPZ37159.1 2-oxoacid:acceptor oxidoreductase subunit alpha [Candidatus Methanoculleus thermohydrogenotrophicum]HQC90626.1 2-oxoacid:acceptor oxidoreductase subunit alpha [Candidatus Methanoculleus thermohydrogenotrophicum]